MHARGRIGFPAVFAAVLVLLSRSPARATSWMPRDDVGVAAVDTRTGKVLWEAWRPDEIPRDVSREERAAAEWLLAMIENHEGPVPRVPTLPDVPTAGLVIEKPWPAGFGVPIAAASQGKDLLYYRHARGVIALDRRTKKEAWRLLTTRFPYPSRVLEAGENRAFIQIGSYVPVALHSALIGGGRAELRIAKLEPHPLKQQVAAAMLLHHYGDGYLRPELRKLVERLRKANNDPAAWPAAKAVEKLLATWPRKRDHQRLLDECVAAVLQAEEGNPVREFPWPAVHPALPWCLLQELIYGSPTDAYSRQGYNYSYSGWVEQPVTLADATKTNLVDHCRQVIATGPDGEKPFAASVLVSTAVGWSRLTDGEKKGLFLSSEPSVWRWAAVGMVKNGRREELIEWARERPAADHLDVLWVLNHNKPKGWADAELAFWVACARHNPGGVASALRLSDGPIPKAFRPPIRSYLEREIAKPTVKEGGVQPAYDLFAAVNLLDSWKDPADTPLLQDYLKHPLQETSTRYDGTVGTVFRVYRLREHVRAMLEKRGVKVPSGIVYEEEVGPAKE